MDARTAVLAAAKARLVVDSAEEGFAEIRARTACSASDAALADAVAALVRERLLRDPVRLLPGRLQCFWCLESVAGTDMDMNRGT
jgi:hypothetical protein